MKSKNIAVIFAGGIGSRMGRPDSPKQFLEVKDKSIIVYTIEHFQNHKDIDAIYISCLESHIPHLKGLIAAHKLGKVKAVVKGGDSALESIFNGLQAAMDDPQNNGDEVVLIHDGVRPIINDKLIKDNILSVHKYGNAISSIPAFETIAESVDDGKTVGRVTARHLVHVLQAPQSFWLKDIYKINRRAVKDGVRSKFFDQAHMMNHYGHKLHMVGGFRGNVKITIPQDYTYFKFLIESGEFKNITGKTIS